MPASARGAATHGHGGLGPSSAAGSASSASLGAAAGAGAGGGTSVFRAPAQLDNQAAEEKLKELRAQLFKSALFKGAPQGRAPAQAPEEQQIDDLDDEPDSLSSPERCDRDGYESPPRRLVLIPNRRHLEETDAPSPSLGYRGNRSRSHSSRRHQSDRGRQWDPPDWYSSQRAPRTGSSSATEGRRRGHKRSSSLMSISDLAAMARTGHVDDDDPVGPEALPVEVVPPYPPVCPDDDSAASFSEDEWSDEDVADHDEVEDRKARGSRMLVDAEDAQSNAEVVDDEALLSNEANDWELLRKEMVEMYGRGDISASPEASPETEGVAAELPEDDMEMMATVGEEGEEEPVEVMASSAAPVEDPELPDFDDDLADSDEDLEEELRARAKQDASTVEQEPLTGGDEDSSDESSVEPGRLDAQAATLSTSKLAVVEQALTVGSRDNGGNLKQTNGSPPAQDQSRQLLPEPVKEVITETPQPSGKAAPAAAPVQTGVVQTGAAAPAAAAQTFPSPAAALRSAPSTISSTQATAAAATAPTVSSVTPSSKPAPAVAVAPQTTAASVNAASGSVARRPTATKAGAPAVAAPAVVTPAIASVAVATSAVATTSVAAPAVSAPPAAPSGATQTRATQAVAAAAVVTAAPVAPAAAAPAQVAPAVAAVGTVAPAVSAPAIAAPAVSTPAAAAPAASAPAVSAPAASAPAAATKPAVSAPAASAPKQAASPAAAPTKAPAASPARVTPAAKVASPAKAASPAAKAIPGQRAATAAAAPGAMPPISSASSSSGQPAAKRLKKGGDAALMAGWESLMARTRKHPDYSAEYTTRFKTEGANWLVALPQTGKPFAVGLDCEMVYAKNDANALARVSVVGVRGTLLDVHVCRAGEHILDYRTPISGVKPEHLLKENGALPFKEVQQKVLASISQDTILVGHSLQSDLRALQIRHRKVVDTALIFAVEGGNHRMKHKLHSLVSLMRSRAGMLRTRNGARADASSMGPHDPRQDAEWALQLALYEASIHPRSTAPLKLESFPTKIFISEVPSGTKKEDLKALFGNGELSTIEYQLTMSKAQAGGATSSTQPGEWLGRAAVSFANKSNRDTCFRSLPRYVSIWAGPFKDWFTRRDIASMQTELTAHFSRFGRVHGGRAVKSCKVHKPPSGPGRPPGINFPFAYVECHPATARALVTSNGEAFSFVKHKSPFKVELMEEHRAQKTSCSVPIKSSQFVARIQ